MRSTQENKDLLGPVVSTLLGSSICSAACVLACMFAHVVLGDLLHAFATGQHCGLSRSCRPSAESEWGINEAVQPSVVSISCAQESAVEKRWGEKEAGHSCRLSNKVRLALSRNTASGSSKS